ncbi:MULTISPECIES: AMP-binding protein [Serratia]|uniref:AMP-binding protein n=1 Tax=Serratia TaxID=613 RepID=UPI0009495DE9|nr:AMP-binding protein [Serratia sp. 506_PEND]
MSFFSFIMLNIYRNRDNLFLTENNKHYLYQDLLISVFRLSHLIKNDTTLSDIVTIKESTAWLTYSKILASFYAGKQVKLLNSSFSEEDSLDHLVLQQLTFNYNDDITEIQSKLTYLLTTDRSERATLSFFSSGTSSGKSTEIISTTNNLFFSSQSIMSVLKYDSSSRIAICTPLSFDYSAYQFLMCSTVGASIIYSDIRRKVGHVFSEFERFNANFFCFIPGILKLYAEYRKKNSSVASPQFITLTGESLPQSLLDECSTLLPHTQIITMYGITECKRVSITPPEICAVNADYCGIALPGVTIKVLKKDQLAERGQGVCMVNGDNVVAGYKNGGPCQFLHYHGETYLYTGDSIDLENGHVTFRGRNSDLVKVNGRRVDIKKLREWIAAVFCSRSNLFYDKGIFYISLDRKIESEETLSSQLIQFLNLEFGVRVLQVKISYNYTENINLKGML